MYVHVYTCVYYLCGYYYTYTCVYNIRISIVSPSLALSLSLYIYMYIHMYLRLFLSPSLLIYVCIYKEIGIELVEIEVERETETGRYAFVQGSVRPVSGDRSVQTKSLQSVCSGIGTLDVPGHWAMIYMYIWLYVYTHYKQCMYTYMH